MWFLRRYPSILPVKTFLILSVPSRPLQVELSAHVHRLCYTPTPVNLSLTLPDSMVSRLEPVTVPLPLTSCLNSWEHLYLDSPDQGITRTFHSLSLESQDTYRFLHTRSFLVSSSSYSFFHLPLIVRNKQKTEIRGS